MIKKFVNNTVFSSNVYVISDNDNFILIDPGFYDDNIKQHLKEYSKLDAILLTHGHFDHIAAIDKIKKDYPEARVYISKEDYNNLFNPELNLSYIMNYDLFVTSEVNQINNEFLYINTFVIKVISTPGHTNGSVMYYFVKENSLFTGDTIMKDSIGTTRYASGNDEQMKESIKKFVELNLSQDTIVYPGHGETDNYKNIKNNNLYINKI